MDALFAGLLAELDFFTTGFGVLTLAALAASIFLLWEWRLALVALILIQTGVAALMVSVHGLPTEWAAVQIMVVLLCALLLALSAQYIRDRQATRPPGPLLLRLMVLVLLLASWRVFDLQLSIPLLNPPVTRLFLWLGLCALTTLALSDSPFFTGVALLVWCVPIQAIVELLVPGHNLFVVIGMVEIVVTLACSYLLLVDLTPEPKPAPVITDSTFMERAPVLPALPAPDRPLLPDHGPVARPQPPRQSGPTPDAPAVARGSQ
jgi:hypothetical protein